MSFRVSVEDAKQITEEWSLVLNAAQLQDPPDYKIYLRTLVTGQPSGPHRVNTFPPLSESGNENHCDAVIRTSLQRFGWPRREVEARVNKFLAHF